MKKIIIIVLILSSVFGQNIENIFSQEANNIDTSSIPLTQSMDLTSVENLTYTPIEQPINPDMYILGPGDLLGINIISTNNISLPIRVNPVGEIMIPAVGILNVDGISLTDARIKISDYVLETALKNAVVNVTLLDVRRFKIQVLGAVHNPGFIYVTPMDKVYDAVLQSGGSHRFAHPANIIQIIRDEEKIEINLKDYLLGIDTSQNILLNPQDIVFVPFNDEAASIHLTSNQFDDHHVVVYGYVNRSGGSNTFKYYPGYTAHDYIAMAGGTRELSSSIRSGNINRTIVYRADGTKVKSALNESILPGDMIEVPPSVLYQIIGGDGIIRTLTTIASIASSIYIIDSISNK
ncbi:polysaccharide biosynthesis/export family protein [Candidatus Neomarinimicrobiota bacterium]